MTSKTTNIFPFLVALVLTLICSTSFAQRISQVGKFEFQGTVRSIKPGQLVIQNEDGKSSAYKVQDADEQAISLDGKLRFSMPAEISFSGTLPFNLLERGMIVRFNAAVSRGGKSKGEVSNLKIVKVPADQLIVTSDEPAKPGTYPNCLVTGQVVRLIRNKVIIKLQKSDHCRQERVTFVLRDDATFEISGDNLNRVRPGDEVTLVKGVELSTGHNIISKIDVRLTAKRKAATTSFNDLLEQKYSSLSDEPREARQERSDHFVLYTDISDRNAAILLEKLETMYNLIGRYYNKRPDRAIECYVVKDLRKFDGALPATGARKIAEGAGVTMSKSNGRTTISVVYSCDNQGVVQHEAVHAYCNQTFGDAGPIWYAEGMAEMGQYWKPEEVAVNIDPVVIDYLTNAEPKKLLDIVAAGQITGDSWQAYAWRWALCYMLAANPNYQRDFKRLGMAMMQGDPNATFENAYGKVAYEVSFEYDQFVKHFGNGYRADLCAWDWKTEGNPLRGKGRENATVKAASGWQSTKLQVQSGKQYDFVTQGEWTIYEEGDPITANGNDSGLGRMVAAILTQEESGEYQLSEPFDLGTQGSFTAPTDGQIVVRCEDEWTDLGDNDGEIEVYFRLSTK
jgi:hypothetical protein